MPDADLFGLHQARYGIWIDLCETHLLNLHQQKSHAMARRHLFPPTFLQDWLLGLFLWIHNHILILDLDVYCSAAAGLDSFEAD